MYDRYRMIGNQLSNGSPVIQRRHGDGKPKSRAGKRQGWESSAGLTCGDLFGIGPLLVLARLSWNHELLLAQALEDLRSQGRVSTTGGSSTRSFITISGGWTRQARGGGLGGCA